MRLAIPSEVPFGRLSRLRRFLATAAAAALLTVGPAAVRPGAAAQAAPPPPAQRVLDERDLRALVSLLDPQIRA